MLSHHNLLSLRGDLTIIRRLAADHSILSVWQKKNVITYAGTEAIVKLLAPNTALGVDVQLNSQIKSIRFGTSNSTAQKTDVGLVAEAQVLSTPVRVQFADGDRIIGVAGTVEFVGVMGTGYGNGVTYREAGLFTRGTDDDPQIATGHAMFSRQVFPDQIKTALVELEFRWRITLTA